MENSNNNSLVKRFEESMPTTKDQVTDIAFELIEKLEKGEMSGLELLRNFKMIEKIQEQIKESMMKAALKEADQYPEKEVEAFGVSFTKMESGTVFDYTGCNDDQYVLILKDLDSWDKEKKARENFLKSIKGSFDIADVSTGEVIKTIYPPVKKSKSTLQVKIK